MPNKTTNYQLNQWAPEDTFLRTDFNEDNAKLEAALTALSGKCEIAIGIYSGDNASTQNIELGFQPKAVLVVSASGQEGENGGSYPQVYGGLALPGHTVSSGGYTALEVTETGFAVHNVGGFDYIRINRTNSTYYYIAFK